MPAEETTLVFWGLRMMCAFTACIILWFREGSDESSFHP